MRRRRMRRAPSPVLRPVICLIAQGYRRSSSCRGSGHAATGCLSRPGTTGVCACLWCSICTAVVDRRQTRPSGLEMVSAREPFIVATLDAEGGRWNVPVQANRADDVAYVRDVIAHVAARVCTDETRVYATGFSGGGRMVSLLGCQLGSQIAAIAPVSGLRFPGPCDGRPVPVLTFHGLADTQNPYDGHAAGRGAEWLESVPDALAGWARVNSCKDDVVLDDPAGPLSTMRYACGDGTEVRMIRIDGLGHAWTKKEIDTTGVMWEFFKSHRLRR